METNGRRITAVENVPADTTYLFTVREVSSGETDEAVLTRADDGVAGWLNRCMHFRHIRLDKGAGAPKRAGEIVCTNHSAMFDEASGRCTHGPCEGAYLEAVEVAVRDGDVYLADDDYEFEGEGGIETDPADLSSESNVKF